MQWIPAGLLAAGLAVSQILFGGAWLPALSVPGYLLVGAAAVTAGFLFWRDGPAPAAGCVGSALLLTGYLWWRQATSPDAYAAREDFWLMLGALAVYLTAAWQLRGDGPRWLVLGVIFALALGQTALAVMQFSAEQAFHPLAELAPGLAPPEEETAGGAQAWVTGTLASRGSLSAVLQASTFLALGLLVWGREGVAVKLLLLWVAAAGFAGLTLCLSRAAYLGVLAGLVTFSLVSFFIFSRGALAHRLALGAGALLLVAGVLLLAFFVGVESVAVRLRMDAVGVDLYRELLWFVTAPPMLALNPWFGVGAGMFDQLSLRYLGPTAATLPVYAHNDWLQLLIEYGRIGFVLGALFLVVHLAAGFRAVLRMIKDLPPAGLLPRSTELGLATGALAVLVGQAVHSIFDFRLHVQAPVLLVALAAGWIAAARTGLATTAAAPWWLRPVGLLPTIAGVALMWSVGRQAAAEGQAMQAENAFERGEVLEVWEVAREGLRHRPEHPQLHLLAGKSARVHAGLAEDWISRDRWSARSAEHFAEAVRQRPLWSEALREYAMALDWSHRAPLAREFHLRAVARDPDRAPAYEHFGLHFWRRGQLDEARRLLDWARRRPAAVLSREYLERIDDELRQRPVLPSAATQLPPP